MPTKTFLNLPEEKRNKVIQAAIKEFSLVQYEKISINKIIKSAEISRGSFYMYFEDKYDLTLYLLEITKNHLKQETVKIFEAGTGDLNELIIGIHNILFDYYEKAEYRNFFKNIIMHFQGRPESEIRSMKHGLPINEEIGNIYYMIDKSQFQNQDKEHIMQIIELTMMVLRNTIFQSFIKNLNKNEATELLKKYLVLLKQGYGRK